MKHFLLTSSKFDGQIRYKFDDEGYLVFFHYEAVMSPEMRKHTLIKMPLSLAGFHELVGNSTTASIQEVPDDISFDAFWNAYAKKHNRKRCEPLWNKLSDKDKLACLASIAEYDKYLVRSGFQGKKDADGFIRERYFDTDWRNYDNRKIQQEKPDY